MRIQDKLDAPLEHIQIVHFQCVRPHMCTPAHLQTWTLAQLQTMQTCTKTHLHTCFCAEVHTFNNLGFYTRNVSAVYFTSQNFSHHVTTKHGTSHGCVCNDVDPRETFIEEITHQYIHHPVSHHISQTYKNCVKRQHSTAQRV